MLDVAHEALLTLRQAAARIPGRAARRSIHVSAVYRWAQRGVRGVVLETAPIGGTLYTSVEALQRFSEACARARGCFIAAQPRKAAEAAVKELERDGF